MLIHKTSTRLKSFLASKRSSSGTDDNEVSDKSGIKLGRLSRTQPWRSSAQPTPHSPASGSVSIADNQIPKILAKVDAHSAHSSISSACSCCPASAHSLSRQCETSATSHLVASHFHSPQIEPSLTGDAYTWAQIFTEPNSELFDTNDSSVLSTATLRPTTRALTDGSTFDLLEALQLPPEHCTNKIQSTDYHSLLMAHPGTQIWSDDVGSLIQQTDEAFKAVDFALTEARDTRATSFKSDWFNTSSTTSASLTLRGFKPNNNRRGGSVKKTPKSTKGRKLSALPAPLRPTFSPARRNDMKDTPRWTLTEVADNMAEMFQFKPVEVDEMLTAERVMRSRLDLAIKNEEAREKMMESVSRRISAAAKSFVTTNSISTEEVSTPVNPFHLDDLPSRIGATLSASEASPPAADHRLDLNMNTQSSIIPPPIPNRSYRRSLESRSRGSSSLKSPPSTRSRFDVPEHTDGSSIPSQAFLLLPVSSPRARSVSAVGLYRSRPHSILRTASDLATIKEADVLEPQRRVSAPPTALVSVSTLLQPSADSMNVGTPPEIDSAQAKCFVQKRRNSLIPVPSGRRSSHNAGSRALPRHVLLRSKNKQVSRHPSLQTALARPERQRIQGIIHSQWSRAKSRRRTPSKLPRPVPVTVEVPNTAPCIKSTPFTLTCPRFRHGPIRIIPALNHKHNDSNVVPSTLAREVDPRQRDQKHEWHSCQGSESESVLYHTYAKNINSSREPHSRRSNVRRGDSIDDVWQSGSSFSSDDLASEIANFGSLTGFPWNDMSAEMFRDASEGDEDDEAVVDLGCPKDEIDEEVDIADLMVWFSDLGIGLGGLVSPPQSHSSPRIGWKKVTMSPVDGSYTHSPKDRRSRMIDKSGVPQTLRVRYVTPAMEVAEQRRGPVAVNTTKRKKYARDSKVDSFTYENPESFGRLQENHPYSPQSSINGQIPQFKTIDYSSPSGGGVLRPTAEQNLRLSSKEQDIRYSSGADSTGSEQSPMMEYQIASDGGDGSGRGFVPMGYNLSHDISDFLEWEVRHVDQDGR